MNQLHDIEASHVYTSNKGQLVVKPLINKPPPTGVPPPLPPRQDPANVNIVNEYISFNLANS